jgi:penicillin-binding protein activator
MTCSRLMLGLALAIGLAATTSCSPTVTSESGAGSGGALTRTLDQGDLNQQTKDLLQSFFNSPYATRLGAEGERPTLAFNGIKNRTTQVVNTGSVEGLMEEELVNCGKFRVVDKANREAFLKEMEQTSGDAFDSRHLAEIGKQFGVQLFLYGELNEIAEKGASQARSQYTLSMKITSVSTGEVLWSKATQITKTVN